LNQLSKKKTYWILQILGWISFSGIITFITSYQDIFSFNYSVIPTIVFNFVILFFTGILSTHYLRYLILKFDWLKLKLKYLIPVFILTAISFSFISLIIRKLINYLFYQISILNIAFNEVLSFVLVFSIVYLLWSLAYFIYHYFESIQEKEIQNISNQAKISEIELQNLKSQLNPHFLFNAMNSIRALISEDPQKAKEAVTQLASILRYSLNTNKNQLVSLESEMVLVKNYLQLEKIRYEERLIYKIDYDDTLNNIKVPPLMIQTLVENAIKHGIAKLPKGGEVIIYFEKNIDLLEIKIENPGKLNEDGQEKGIGLVNTKERLKILFNKKSEIKIEEKDGKIITHLIIPIT